MRSNAVQHGVSSCVFQAMPDRHASPVPFVADPCARRAVARRLLGPVQREVDICVRRYATASRDTRQDAHDLAQDVLVSLFDRDARELRRWDPARGRSLESFVRLVARRRVTRAIRRCDRTRARISDGCVERHGIDARPLLEARRLLEQLLHKMQPHLRGRDHDLFELVFVQELEPSEVAERVGITRTAVNAWTYRKRQLARELANEDRSR
jgi:RNA polymerase sigma factor (sigma-70 family)